MTIRNTIATALMALSLLSPAPSAHASTSQAPSAAAPVQTATVAAPAKTTTEAPKEQPLPFNADTFQAAVRVIDSQGQVISNQGQIIELLVRAANQHEARIKALEDKLGINKAAAKPTAPKSGTAAPGATKTPAKK